MALASATNRGSELNALVREAWGNLVALRQRSALALLGIAIGSTSVVAMLSVGQMALREALRPFNEMGVDLLSVQVTHAGQIQGLPLASIDRLPHAVPGVIAATPFGSRMDTTGLRAGAPPVTTLAARPNLLSVARLHLSEGRFLTEADGDSLVAVIGANLARPDSAAPSVRLHERVRAGRYLYRVIGILRPTLHNSVSPADLDHSIIIPLESARRSLDTAAPTGALIRIAPDADGRRVAERLVVALKSKPDDQIAIVDARQAVAAVKAQKAVHTRLLAGVAGISLFVGGLGVMNVMLMGMMERRTEIGLRAALGATPTDIHLMFLAEAVMLASAGGVLGTVTGVAVAWGIARVSHWPFEIALYSLPLGTLVAATVGVIFGLYPAIRAARLSPVEALRAH